MKLTIEVPKTVHDCLTELVDECQTSDSSHGPLTVETLARMLLEDAAMVVSRPGSWEGAGLRRVLAAHGYQT